MAFKQYKTNMAKKIFKLTSSDRKNILEYIKRRIYWNVIISLFYEQSVKLDEAPQ